MWFPTLAQRTLPPKNHFEATRPISWQSKGNSKCSAKPSEMASLLLASSTTNNAHVADVAVDINAVATKVEAATTVAADTMAVVATTTVVVVPTRTQTAAAASAAAAMVRAATTIATRMQMAALATMVAAAQTAVDTALAIRTQATNLPRQSSISTTGTTAARMAVMWTTTTPVQHAPAQGKTINAWRHGRTPWVAPYAACTRPSFPAPSANGLHQCAPPRCLSTTRPLSSIHSATPDHVFP